MAFIFVRIQYTRICTFVQCKCERGGRREGDMDREKEKD